MSSRSPLAFLTRRRFLALIAGGAGVAVAGVGGLAVLRGSAPPVEGLSVLDAQEYRTLANVARTFLPRGGPFEPGAADFDLARAFDAYLADEPASVATDLKRALLLVEYGPVLFEGRATTFSHLDHAGRLAHWESWMYSERLIRRQVAVGLRKFLALVFFDQPAVWPHIGYPGPSYHGMP